MSRGQACAAAVLAVVTLLPLVPGAGAADELPTGHDFAVHSARLDLAHGADLSTLTVDYSIPEPDPASEGDTCEDAQVRVDEAAGTFTFDDTAVTDGCADVQLPVAIPPGADRLVIRFEANRVIRQEGGLPMAPGSLQVQQFRILGPDGTIEFAEDYFDDTEGSHEEPEPFVVDEAIGRGATNLTLSWLFDDQGFQGERLSTFQDFDATVGAISLSWPGILLPTRVEQGTETQRNATVGAVAFNVTVDVPPVPAAPQLDASLTMATRHGARLDVVVGPGGPVPLANATIVDAGDELRVTLGPDAFAADGPGPYVFSYTSLRLLPPAAPPGSPATIFPFYYMMLLLPLPAAALALHNTAVYRREAEGRHRRASAGMLAMVVIAVVYYAGLVAYAVLVAGRGRMATLPLQPQATLLYAQLVFVLLFFVVAAIVIGRYFVRAMQHDLEQRRIQEERLRRSNEELERFAYVASHDLQEPLRKVAGFTSLLQRRYKGRLDKDADEMIQYAVDGATRMQALIRDILAYSRVGSGELDIHEVDLGAMMELVTADLGEKIKEESAHVEWDGLPTVDGDAGQLRQVLQNLVENALKYRHPARRPRVRVFAERTGGEWRFGVSDNGVGIPPDKLQDIFGIFRRLHGAEVPGTGIGLALAKKAIERHGGKIWAESRQGKGSTFYFTLPARPEPRQPGRFLARAGAPAAPGAAGPEKDGARTAG